jgi:hypothetical protein
MAASTPCPTDPPAYWFLGEASISVDELTKERNANLALSMSHTGWGEALRSFGIELADSDTARRRVV